MVGYRVKLDTRVGPKTHIEVVTSGILIRKLQQAPRVVETSFFVTPPPR